MALGARVLGRAQDARITANPSACPVTKNPPIGGRETDAPEAQTGRKCAVPWITFFWKAGCSASDPFRAGGPHAKPGSPEEVNARLQDYDRKHWNRMVDGWVHLSPPDLETIVQWRMEAEERMKAAGKPGMTRTETESYVRLFLPAYRLYLPTLSLPMKICSGKSGSARTACPGPKVQCNNSTTPTPATFRHAPPAENFAASRDVIQKEKTLVSGAVRTSIATPAGRGRVQNRSCRFFFFFFHFLTKSRSLLSTAQSPRDHTKDGFFPAMARSMLIPSG